MNSFKLKVIGIQHMWGHGATTAYIVPTVMLKMVTDKRFVSPVTFGTTVMKPGPFGTLCM